MSDLKSPCYEPTTRHSNVVFVRMKLLGIAGYQPVHPGLPLTGGAPPGDKTQSLSFEHGPGGTGTVPHGVIHKDEKMKIVLLLHG